jgi:CRISPR-associated endonuclease/helicase Cas3
MSDTTFQTRFDLLTGNKPFPWQIDLFENWFAKGRFPNSCNLPTGLGKTSVIAIWLLALMDHPEKIPRRLVYVVNRRTVVDQTTDEVMRIHKNLAKLEKFPDSVRELRISTLRGQFADNRRWSEDPSYPAVICGTVDMIGSRLLFSGYGVGFKAKPLHAGFLGQDVLVVHDEAHLEPAFQALLIAIEKAQREDEQSQTMPWPRLRVMELTATSRQKDAGEEKEKQFTLTDAEKINLPEIIPDPATEPIHNVWRRMRAKKGVKFLHVRRTEVAEMIGRNARSRRDSGKAVIIFVRTVESVEVVRRVLLDKKEGINTEQVQVLTGTQRGRERDYLATEDPVFARFLSGPRVTPREGTVYLICTSAGEVGVDISADHMVCDLTTLDSMAQRLGRVNRRGDGNAEIDVVYESDPDSKPKSPDFEKARWKTKEILKRLPTCAWPGAEDRHGASPLELLNLHLSDAERNAAFAPQPTILPVTDILLDAWSLTTISPPLVRAPLPGRRVVEPYLHGISDWQPPETYVAWREEVEVICGDFLELQSPEDLLEDYPLKPHELLRDRSDRVFKHLQSIAAEHPEAPVWLVDMRDRILVTSLKDLIGRYKTAINYATVLLPPFVGGLTKTGMLDAAAARKQSNVGGEAQANLTVDNDDPVQYDVADEWYEDKERTRRRRIRLWDGGRGPSDMTLEREVRFDDLEEERAGPTRVWRWFVRKPEAANERGREAYELDAHLNDVGAGAIQITGRLFDAHSEIAKAVVLAARCHDLGKNRERWQHSLGNDRYPDKVYAKSGKLRDGAALRPRDFLRDRYRHEFGSVLDLRDETHPRYAEFKEMSPEMRDLVLHLIAAHHGRGRPHFPADEAFDPKRNSQAAMELAIEIPQRFARLQRKYGRWGLAYIESLVRAADYFASANPGKTSIQPGESEG